VRPPNMSNPPSGSRLRTLIEVGAVVVLFVELVHAHRNLQSQSPYLTTGHTTTTRVLPVLADATGGSSLT